MSYGVRPKKINKNTSCINHILSETRPHPSSWGVTVYSQTSRSKTHSSIDREEANAVPTSPETHSE